MALSLSMFLSSARVTILHGSKAATPFTIVLGNPSADLDSFISAVVYAYFHSCLSQSGGTKRLYVPVLNLPTTPAYDLWRLRPEFVTALKLAHGPMVEQNSSNMSSDEHSKGLIEQLVTLADIRSASKSTPLSLFSDLATQPASTSSKKDDYVLVDHNALTMPTESTETLNQHVNVIGCIDHHVDESFVPINVSPRIIKTGVGSCTSLVIQYIRDIQLWPLPDEGYATGELARLALAPILIDTANLTAEGKVSDIDRDAVAFLESCIQSTPNLTVTQQEWNRKSFYNEIATTKANSLDLLTFPEVFERDYKEWMESTKGGEELNMGVSSVVKPITWLLEKAKNVEEFLSQVQIFTHSPKHKLALFGIMTTYTSESGDFQRELFMTASGSTASKALKDFEARATKELDLKPWDANSELLDLMRVRLGETNEFRRLWWQQDVTKSRKQVAPLLREVVKGC